MACRSFSVAFFALLLALSCTKSSSSKVVNPSLMCNSLPEAGSGKRKSSEIERKLSAHLDRFEACYQRAVQHDPKAAGRVETLFVIDSDGSVSSACVQKTTLEDGEAVECMLDQFRALRFGPAKGTTTVIYPLSYGPG